METLATYANQFVIYTVCYALFFAIYRVLRIVMLLWLRACAFYIFRHLAKCQAKLNVALKLAGMEAVALSVFRGIELEKAEFNGPLGEGRVVVQHVVAAVVVMVVSAVGGMLAGVPNVCKRCHAGRLLLVDLLQECFISMTIFQPRRDNISTFTIAKDELLAWAESTLAPTAKLAYEGKGEFKAGDHCQFCKIKATCRKRAEYNLEMARYDFEMPANLDNIEIAAILDKADQLSSWVEDVKEYALAEALKGTRFDGYKVVAGRANRKYTDESAAAAAVIAAGADPYEKKVLGITAMTALLGKKKFEEILGSLVIKPQGKPVLVKADDKRPEYNSAINDFNE